MATIQEQAAAAFQAERTAQIAARRAALKARLTPYDPAAATVADWQDGGPVVFLADGLALAVAPDGTVQVVEGSAATGWQVRTTVTSLAGLGRWLAQESARPVYPAWVQPTSKETAYPLGARVTHNGAVWLSTVKDNMGEPGVSGWNREA